MSTYIRVCIFRHVHVHLRTHTRVCRCMCVYPCICSQVGAPTLLPSMAPSTRWLEELHVCPMAGTAPFLLWDKTSPSSQCHMLSVCPSLSCPSVCAPCCGVVLMVLCAPPTRLPLPAASSERPCGSWRTITTISRSTTLPSSTCQNPSCPRKCPGLKSIPLARVSSPVPWLLLLLSLLLPFSIPVFSPRKAPVDSREPTVGPSQPGQGAGGTSGTSQSPKPSLTSPFSPQKTRRTTLRASPGPSLQRLPAGVTTATTSITTRRLSMSAGCGNAAPGTGLGAGTGCPIAAPFGVHRTAPQGLWGFPRACPPLSSPKQGIHSLGEAHLCWALEHAAQGIPGGG